MARLRRAAKKLLIILVCIVAVYFLARGILFAVYGPKVKKEIALLIAEGGSMRISDLAPKPVPEDEENPARLILAAGLIYNDPLSIRTRRGRKPDLSVDFEDMEAPEELKIARALYEFSAWLGMDIQGEKKKSYAWNDDWLPLLEKHLEENAIPLTLIKEAASLGWGVFDVDWDKGFETRLPHLRKLRGAARLLRLEAVIRARRGDMAGAMEDVRLIFRLRRFVDDEPTLISKLVAIALDSIACSALKGVLVQGSPDRESVEMIFKELEGREKSNRLVKAFLGETATGIQFFEAVRKDARKIKEISGSHALFSLGFRLIWVRPADEYHYLRIMRLFRDASRENFPDALEEAKLAQTEAELQSKRAWLAIPFKTLTSIITPALGRALVAMARADASTGMARTVLALSLYRSEVGGYPDSLQPLVPKYLPALQIDPFDGKPLRYRRKGEGYVVYSVADNKTDDGRVWRKEGVRGVLDWPWVMEQ